MAIQSNHRGMQSLSQEDRWTVCLQDDLKQQHSKLEMASPDTLHSYSLTDQNPMSHCSEDSWKGAFFLIKTGNPVIPIKVCL